MHWFTLKCIRWRASDRQRRRQKGAHIIFPDAAHFFSCYNQCRTILHFVFLICTRSSRRFEDNHITRLSRMFDRCKVILFLFVTMQSAAFKSENFRKSRFFCLFFSLLIVLSPTFFSLPLFPSFAFTFIFFIPIISKLNFQYLGRMSEMSKSHQNWVELLKIE